MIEVKNQKIVPVTNPGAIVNNAAFNTIVIDTRGFRFVTIVIMLGALDIAMTALKLQESELPGTGFVDVQDADFSVSPNALPTATADNNLFAIHVDMRGRKRYLDLVMTGGNGSTGTYASVFAVLSRAETAPSSATDRGFTAELSV